MKRLFTNKTLSPMGGRSYSNRAISLLLCFALLLTMMPQVLLPVNSVGNEQQNNTTTNNNTPSIEEQYKANIGKYAEFSVYFPMPITDKPENVDNVFGTETMKLFTEEVSDGFLLRIVDVYYNETHDLLWYKVEAAPGLVLPEKLQQYPWVFQDNVKNSFGAASLILQETVEIPSISGDHGVTISAFNLPEGATLNVTIPEVDGETLTGIFDIKIYLTDDEGNYICDENGEPVEWQPIDYGTTVQISIPVEGVEDGEYVDVLHFIDYALDIDGDEQIISTEDAPAEWLEILQPAIAACGDGTNVPVEIFHKVCIVEGVVQIETNSFSLYLYDGSNYVKQDAEEVDGRVVVTFNSSYSSSGSNSGYSDVTQYFYASPEQLFRLRTSDDNVWQTYKNPYSIIEKPSDATDEESTSAQVLNNPSVYLENLDEAKDAFLGIDGWRTRHAHLNIVGLLPGDVIWLQCKTENQTTYMKVVIVDEVNITFDKNLASATLQNTTYGPVATDGDPDKNLFTIPTAIEYIPKSNDPRYIFTGWNTSPAGDGTSYTYNATTGTFSPASFTPMRDMTLYAMWDADNYVVNFDANGGAESYDPVIVTDGTITLPEAPTRADYEFIGWSATTDGYSKIYPAGEDFTVYQDTILYALWAVNLIVVVSGGTLTLQLEDEFESTSLDDRYYATSGNKMFEKTENPDGSITYTGKPIEGFLRNARFTFTYSTSKKAMSSTTNESLVTIVQQTGQVFATIGPGGMDKSTTIVFSAVEKDWVSYTVSYETNFGTPVSANVLTGQEGDAINLDTLPTTTREGYTFAGWYKDVAFTDGPYTKLENITSDVILYAKWTANKYTVTWVDDDATVLETDTDVPYGTTPEYNGATPTKPADAQYTYAFSGWDPVVSPVTGDVTYTAQYDKTLNQYTVTWVDGFGKTLHTVTQDYGSALTYPADPSHEGYTFAGWDKNISIVPGEDVTITATWKISLRIGINVAYYTVGNNYYHVLPNTPTTQHDFPTVRAYYENSKWKFTNTQGDYVHDIGLDFTLNIEKLFADYPVASDDGTYGVVDHTGEKIKEYFQFNFYDDLLAAWVGPNAPNLENMENVEIDWSKLGVDDCSIIPYVVKLQSDGVWYVDMLVVVNKTSLTISVDGDEVDSADAFVYQISSDGMDTLTVAVRKGAPVTIEGLIIGKQYTITQLATWSWKYGASPKWVCIMGSTKSSSTGNAATITLTETATITFTNTLEKDYWLGGESSCEYPTTNP